MIYKIRSRHFTDRGRAAPGGILVLSMNYVDYSLSEISRLIEENHAKIFK